MELIQGETGWKALRQAVGTETQGLQLEQAITELNRWVRGCASKPRPGPAKKLIALARAILLDPGEVRLYIARAEAYLKMQDLQSAITNLRWVREQAGSPRLLYT